MVAGGGEGSWQRVCDEKAVPEKGTLKDKVNEGVKQVPDKKNTRLDRRRSWQCLQGGSICSGKQGDYSEQRQYRRGIDFRSCTRNWRRGSWRQRRGFGIAEESHGGGPEVRMGGINGPRHRQDGAVIERVVRKHSITL